MLPYPSNRNRAFAFSTLAIGLSFLLPVEPVKSLPVSHFIPIDLAVQAATEAVKACQAKGYNVTATIVNKEGGRQVVIRGDGAPPHTLENSYNKAYTIITLGPVQKVLSTTEIVKAVSPPANPIGNWPLSPSPLPGITFSSGGIAIALGNEIIGGLGVAGSPGGLIDEDCAQAGLNKIRDRLNP